MCGICGYIGKKRDGLLQSMMNLMIHRGPDGEGVFEDGPVHLGHRRLSIIDLSPRGAQPMTDENGRLQLVYNGMLYNYRELRADLKGLGHRFQSESDTEVILHAYEEWGYHCLERFNGMWAFCIYDPDQQVLFLSRDRLGIKPLYYLQKDEVFVFSSEIKPLLLSLPKRSVNRRILFDYLMYSALDHSEETFFQGVKKLPAGAYGVYDLRKHRLSIHSWWNCGASDTPPDQLDPPGQFRDLFMDSVKLRMRSDVPVGSCLSGGLDSSAIVSSIGAIQEGVDSRFSAFSAVYPGQPFDESRYIDIVIQRTGFRSVRVSPTAEDLARDLDRLIYIMEEPMPICSMYAQYRVMEIAHDAGLKVLLDGQGSDELLAGYFTMYAYYFRELLARGNLVNLSREIAGYLRNHRSLFPVALFLSLLLPGKTKQKFIHYGHLLSKEFRREGKSYGGYFNELIDSPDLSSALRALLSIKLEHLLKWEDRNSMSHSIETRLPFLDYRLLSFLQDLPSRWKIHRGETKYILRKGLRDLLPPEIARRQDKIGFATPEKEWLSSPAIQKILRGHLLSPECRSRGIFNPVKLESAVTRPNKLSPMAARSLWRALSVEIWFKKFIDN